MTGLKGLESGEVTETGSRWWGAISQVRAGVWGERVLPAGLWGKGKDKWEMGLGDRVRSGSKEPHSLLTGLCPPAEHTWEGIPATRSSARR